MYASPQQYCINLLFLCKQNNVCTSTWPTFFCFDIPISDIDIHTDPIQFYLCKSVPPGNVTEHSIGYKKHVRPASSFSQPSLRENSSCFTFITMLEGSQGLKLIGVSVNGPKDDEWGLLLVRFSRRWDKTHINLYPYTYVSSLYPMKNMLQL